MYRLFSFAVALAVAATGGLITGSPAISGPAGEHLNSGYQLHAGEDACPNRLLKNSGQTSVAMIP